MSALTSLLVRDKIVPVKKIEEAIQRQVISGGEMDTVLLELRAVAENVLNGYCAAVYGLSAASRDQVMQAPPDVVALVPREVAEGHRVVPIAVEGETLVLAAAEPLGADVEQQLGFLLRMDVQVRIVNAVRVAAALHQLYGAELSSRDRRLLEKLDKREPGSIPKVEPPDANLVTRELAEASPDEAEPARYSYARPSAELQASLEANIAPLPADVAPVPFAPRESRVSLPFPRPAEVEEAAQPARAHAPVPPATPSARPKAPPARPSILAKHRGPLTARHAVELFGKAENRDDILQVFFAFSEQFFDYTALFMVHDDVAEGMEARGAGASTEQVRAIDVPLKVKGTFGAVYELQGTRVGNLDISSVDLEVRQKLGREAAQPSAVLPVTIGKRVVLMLYGDRTGEAFGVSDLPELFGMLPRVSDAFQQLILRRKIQAREPAPPSEPEDPGGRSAPSSGGGDAPPELASPAAGGFPSARPAAASAWTSAARTPVAEDERSSMEAAFHSVSERPYGASATPISEPPPPTASYAAPPSAVPPPPKRRPVALPGVPRTAPPPPTHGAARPASSGGPTAPRAPGGLGAGDRERATPGPRDRAAHPGDADDEGGAGGSEGIGAYSLSGAAVDVVSPRPATPRRRSEPPPRRPHSDRPPAAPRFDPRREDGGGAIAAEVVRVGEALASGATGVEATTDVVARPSVPAADEPSVIVSMGADIDLLVDDVRDAGPDDEAPILRVIATGEAALPALVRQFPGTLWFDRHQAHRRLPRGRDLSAIARVIVALGETSIPYLTPLLEHPSADVRYYALLVASELHRADLATAVGRLILDEDPAVSALAVELLRSYRRHLAEYTEALEHARSVARAPRGEPATRAAAAWALGELRDERSLSLLVSLLDGQDRRLADTAHRSLVALTRQDFGLSSRKWQGWVERHGREHRIEWLIDALGHADEEMRRVASDELKQLTQEYFGYHHALPKREREMAQRKYRDWWEAGGRARFGG